MMKKSIAFLCVAVALLGGGVGLYQHFKADTFAGTHPATKTQASSSAAAKSSANAKSSSASSTKKKSKVEAALRTHANYKKPSETIAYPTLSKLKHFWIHVSIMKNRVYLMNGKKVVYIMYASAGKVTKKNGKLHSTTPTGTYYIQAERGKSFYNASLGEGANYWTSWLNHGEYLFHTVPTDASGHYKKAEAKKLGHAAASHGCIRLSIPDAKWINSHVQVGTKVKITLK